MKKKYQKISYVIAVHTTPSIRHSRIEKKSFRGLDKKTAIAREYSHIEELDIGGPIAMADFHMLNDGDINELHEKLSVIYATLK